MSTKTAAAKLATAKLRFGFFQESNTVAYTFCPECRERVNAEKFAWEKWSKQLHNSLVNHLVDAH